MSWLVLSALGSLNPLGAKTNWSQECAFKSQDILALSHHSDLQLDLTRHRYRSVLALPLILSLLAFGQTGSAGMNEAIPMRYVGMFRADGDVLGDRTPCQRFRDIVKPSAAARDVAPESSAVCDQVLDIIAGRANRLPKDVMEPIQAAKVAVDSHQRILLSEPGKRTVHILDFANKKFLRIDVTKGDRMSFPYAIATDADDKIYVTDLERGRIAVYSPQGKFIRYIGNFKSEGLFQRPESIAIDRATGRIFLVDTSRGFVIILDLSGKILAQVGKRGGGDGPAEFREPTAVAIYKNDVFVLDKQNARIQVLDSGGRFQRQFALEGSATSEVQGMAFDAQGRLLTVALGWVEGFDQDGKLLFRLGHNGDQPGEFHWPQGICTDQKNRAYVLDSGNRRVQVFQVVDQPESKTETPR